MITFIRKAGLATAVLLASFGASAGVTVTFAHPEKMTDVPRFAADRENLEWHLRQHFDTLAKGLPAGQTLTVNVLDIDLAGDVFPRVPVRDIRVMKGRADWPRLHLRYAIEQDGQVVKSGEKQLADPNYLMGINRYSNEIFSHEKQMLDDWWRKEVVAAR